MAPNHAQSLTVLFVDICGSTKLYSDLGNEHARRIVTECIDRLKAIATRQNGIVIQTMGDGILCTFLKADDACYAATAMRDAQRELDLAIHAGFHIGHVIVDRNSIYGDAVNVASRVANLAKAGEIITTDESVAQLSTPLREQTRLLGKIAVKGKNAPLRVYAVVADETDITAYRPRGEQTGIQPSKLQLVYKGRTSEFDSQGSELVIGRSAECDLVIEDPFASRRHATIEGHRGKFFLVDHSTNGTYVIKPNSEFTLVRRETVQLLGSGFLSMGGDPTQDRGNFIEYRDLIRA
jgi:adenylate cyclase